MIDAARRNLDAVMQHAIAVSKKTGISMQLHQFPDFLDAVGALKWYFVPIRSLDQENLHVHSNRSIHKSPTYIMSPPMDCIANSATATLQARPAGSGTVAGIKDR